MAIDSYHLGCPSWGFQRWVGGLYRRKSRPAEFLGQYARVFNTVEGNTTFYSLPSPESVRRWQEETPDSFRFCFKFPRVITHEKRLSNVSADTAEFLTRLAPLGERLGPFMIQFPASLTPADLPALEAYLGTLPEEFRYTVELRHRQIFASEEAVRRLDAMLVRCRCRRVVLETRPLRSGDMNHPDVGGTRNQKPNLPVYLPQDDPFPLVRFISHPEDAMDEPWLERWSRIVADWLDEGRRPYVMIHCPNDVHSPRIARHFHQHLRGLRPVGEMPPWPGEEEDEGGQLRLALE